MDCSELDKLLSEHPLPELTEKQRADVAAHLDACEHCWVKWDLEDDSWGPHHLREAFPPFDTLKDVVMSRVNSETTEQGQARPEDEGEEDHPERIGGFEILCPLGKGGMGTVYKARQVSMERIVALKLLPKRLEKDEAYVARFFREARAAAKLRDLHIVQAYDVGHADGRYFFAMEYVDGDDLQFILRRDGVLDPERALKYLKQTCRALMAAHKHGVIHRDIKPSNLVIDSEDCLRVADFGLAKRTEGDAALTADGQALGTPAYVAPELASGKPVDGRTDLYSLGASFFRLLSGRPVFGGSSFAEVVVKQVNEAPPKLQDVAPHVDRRLCRIIDCLLSKSPEARYDSAETLLAALDALGKLQVPAVADRVGDTATTLVTSDPTQERKGRRGVRLAAALVGLLLLAGLIFLSQWKSVGEEPSRPLFDGVTLNGWERVQRLDVHPEEGTGESGPVRVLDGAMVLGAGQPFTAVRWAGEFPRIDYEVRLEAMRTSGDRDFCIVMFPVGPALCSLQMGSWDQDLVGLDKIDGLDPRDNGTGMQLAVEDNKWYAVRLRVTHAAISAWVDGDQVIDLPVPGHTFTVHPKWEPVKPFGIATAWTTGGAVRDIWLSAARVPEQQGVLLLLACDEWHDANVDLVEGRSYEIAATGRWGHGHRSSMGPEGHFGSPTDGFPLPSAMAYCLIGRVGPEGAPFAIGERLTLTAERSGRLHLQMNDSELGDNTGSLRITIREAERERERSP